MPKRPVALAKYNTSRLSYSDNSNDSDEDMPDASDASDTSDRSGPDSDDDFNEDKLEYFSEKNKENLLTRDEVMLHASQRYARAEEKSARLVKELEDDHATGSVSAETVEEFKEEEKVGLADKKNLLDYLGTKAWSRLQNGQDLNRNDLYDAADADWNSGQGYRSPSSSSDNQSNTGEPNTGEANTGEPYTGEANTGETNRNGANSNQPVNNQSPVDFTVEQQSTEMPWPCDDVDG